jgi:hypothetical protein
MSSAVLALHMARNTAGHDLYWRGISKMYSKPNGYARRSACLKQARATRMQCKEEKDYKSARTTKKPLALLRGTSGFEMVAGTGFEPVTFGL